MYHPYFRGKQYDLITVRDLAPTFATAGFTPIIEPVREALTGLKRALDAVVSSEGTAVVIVNPHHGDLSGTAESVTELLDQEFENSGISAGILLKPKMSLQDVVACYEAHAAHSPMFIHCGYGEPKALADYLGPANGDQKHAFLERCCGKLYQKHFKGTHRILLRDGFVRQKRNSDYPDVELFSDLHATFADEGMNGFGDFLMVGDDYSESGGPAYAVAIHLTFIDPAQDDAMYIYHFKSDTQDTPTDPAGKFAEALENMMTVIDDPGSNVFETNAVKEFRQLHEDGHFPGLGSVKKLSMSHHIETLADYFEPK
jgi:hypothetical protein